MTMKIITEVGNLLDYNGPIAHGANCKGLMGAGVAAGIRSKFPYVYEKYREAYYDGLLVPGMVYPVWNSRSVEPVWVFNLLTQFKPGAHAELEHIYNALVNMSIICDHYQIPEVATVPLGCGIGGLEWADVRKVIEQVTSDTTLRVFDFKELS